MVNLVANPAPMFFDIDGSALNGGTVYVGMPNVDPVNNPISVYQDPALSIPMQQPLKVAEGVVFLNGSPRQVFTSASQFSMAIFNSRGVMVASYPAVSAVAQLPPTGGTLDKIYKASSGDFVPGTTTQLTLPADPGTVSNMIITFDGLTQHDDQVQALAYPTLTFTSPIPVGIQEVQIKIGSTTSGSIAPPGSVTDASVAADAGIQSSKLAFLQAGAGAVSRTVQSKLRETFAVTDFGDGSTAFPWDNAVASALAAMGTGGGYLYFPTLPVGQTPYQLNNAINLASRTGVRLQGDGGETAGAAAATSIAVNYASTGGVNDFISAQDSVGFGVAGIQFVVKNPGLTGYVIALGQISGGSAFSHFEDLSILGGTTARYNAKGINLNKAIEVSLERVNFGALALHITGSAASSFSNVVSFRDCQFIDSAQIPIQGGGEAWCFDDCTFEGFNNGTPGQALAGAIANLPANIFKGLEFRNNWCGDVSADGGVWLQLSGGGINVRGNMLGGSAGSNAMSFASVTGAISEGNYFDGFNIAHDFGASNTPGAIGIGPNSYNSVANRIGSSANYPGYASAAVMYFPVGNGKLFMHGTVSVTAGTPANVNFPFSVASVDTVTPGFSGAPGSATSTWCSSKGSGGIVLNVGGSGTASVDWHAVAVPSN